MASIIMIAEFFLLSLGLGVGIFSFLANTKETGAGFLRVVMGVCGGSTLGALILHLTYGHYLDPQSTFYYLALAGFLVTYLYHRDKKSLLMWAAFVVHNLALVMTLYYFHNANKEQFFFALSSVLFLGSVTYAMVMGHWYLVTPKLSEQPLKYALYFMWAFLVLKLVWTGISVGHSFDFFASGTYKGGGYAFNWLMLTMRLGWGYLVLGIMSYFAYRLVSMRSIQSATGILYAMTFFVFVGELISNYMFFEYGLLL